MMSFKFYLALLLALCVANIFAQTDAPTEAPTDGPSSSFDFVLDDSPSPSTSTFNFDFAVCGPCGYVFAQQIIDLIASLVTQTTSPPPVQNDVSVIAIVDPSVDCISTACGSRRLIELYDEQRKLLEDGITAFEITIETPGVIDEGDLLDAIVASEDAFNLFLEDDDGSFLVDNFPFSIDATEAPASSPSSSSTKSSKKSAKSSKSSKSSKSGKSSKSSKSSKSKSSKS